MKMKRMLSLILAFVMVLGMVPGSVFATEGEEVPSVTVTLSLSADDALMVGPGSDTIMALQDITVPYFDLALYGLEEYYFVSETYGDDGDGKPGSDLEPGTAEYAEGKVTLLHLYIYALEVFYCGIEPEDAGKGYLYEQGLIGTEVFSISGGVGSSFMNQFWGGDCNLNYYVNYEYPLASDGWGATSDQILLREGDIITLGHFTGWSFYADPYSIFNYITADNTEPIQGEEVTLTLYVAGPNLGTSTDTDQTVNTRCLDVYYAPVDDIPSEYVTDWEYLGTADDNGELVVDTSVLEPGEYVIAVAGQRGEIFPDDICSTPGGVRLSVMEPHTHNYGSKVTAPTCTEGGYTTYTCECGESYIADETEALGHDYVDGFCTVCGEPDPDFVPETPEVTVIATGWSGYTTWALSDDGTLTFTPTEQSLDGQTNLKNYRKVNGVLTLPWGEYADMITTVVVEDGIHDIGQMAFYELPNLTEVVLPESIVEIRNYAFKNCKSLTTINLENVDFIREGAFYGCSGLENVTFCEGVVIEDWAFSRTNITLP